MKNGITRKPRRVTQETAAAYKKRSGFSGIGKKIVEHGRSEDRHKQGDNMQEHVAGISETKRTPSCRETARNFVSSFTSPTDVMSVNGGNA